MLRIGDFSKLSRVSIKALRLYDEMGLLKPVAVDRFTNYRYYEFSQLSRLYRILALKDLGFSLEEVGHLLESELPVEQLHGMLRLRRAEIHQRVREETQRLERVETLLHQLEQENIMTTYDVVVKRLPPLDVVSIRGVVPTPGDQMVLWDQLMVAMNAHSIRMTDAPISVYHDPDAKERDWDIEVCCPVGKDATPGEGYTLGVLPGFETVACVVHTNSFATIGQAYDALAKWISQNGYRILGPTREINLRVPDNPGDQHDPNTVVEIQFPVARA